MTSKERLLNKKQSWPYLSKKKFLLASRKAICFKAVKRFRIKEIIPRSKFYHLFECIFKL